MFRVLLVKDLNPGASVLPSTLEQDGGRGVVKLGVVIVLLQGYHRLNMFGRSIKEDKLSWACFVFHAYQIMSSNEASTQQTGAMHARKDANPCAALVGKHASFLYHRMNNFLRLHQKCCV